METNLVLSLGSIIGIVSLFYAWHKEQKQTSMFRDYVFDDKVVENTKKSSRKTGVNCVT